MATDKKIGFNLDQLNFGYSALVIAAFGIAGSAGSFLAVSSIFIAIVSVALGFTVLTVDKRVLWLSAACAFYLFSGLLVVLTHWGDAIAVDYLFRYLTFCGLVFLWSRFSYTDPKQLLLGAIYGGVISAFAVGGWAIFQTFIQPVIRVEGLAGNALPFATIASSGFCLSLLGIVIFERFTSKVIATCGVFLAIFAIVAAQSRTMFPILLIAPLIVFMLIPKTRKIITSRNIIVFLVLCVLVLAFNFDFITSRTSPAINYLLANGFTPVKDNSLGIRFALWTCASQELPQHFWFGMGPENVRAFIQSCTQSLIGKTYTFTHFHNFVLTSLMNGGVIEFIAATLILVLPSVLVIKYRDKTSLVSTAGSAIVLLTASILLLQGVANLMFGHDIHDFLFIYLTALGLAIAIPLKHHRSDVLQTPA